MTNNVYQLSAILDFSDRQWYITINPQKIHFRAMPLLSLDLCMAVLLFLLDNLAAADVTC